MQIARWIVAGAQIYAGLGLAGASCSSSMELTDFRLAPASWAFRPLLLPGFMLLWPLALVRWIKCRKKPDAEP